MTFLRDVRFGLRMLARHRTHGITAVAVVALGIGAATAVFSVIRGVLLRPLPYREPDRLVLFRADLPGFAHQPALTSQEYAALEARTDLFESVAVVVEADGNLTAPDDMTPLIAAAISENFFQTLGVGPALGRSLSTGDDRQRWSIDIGYDVWQRHFHGDPDILGHDIEVNNNPMTVAGVLPRGFKLHLGPGVALSPQIDIWYHRGGGYDRDPFRGNIVIARLRRGVTLAAARAGVDALVRQLVADHPSSYRTGPVRLSISTLDQEVVSDVKPALVAVAGAVTFVLLVACANLANLLLARALARSRELALRISIGASRGHIVRQLLAEGLLLGGLGAGAGLLIAQWGVDGLLRLAPATLPMREAIVVDATVATFAIAVSLACALLVSLIPAWHATRPGLSCALNRDPASSRSAGTTRGLLVASQLALSLVLLVGAGLMTRAFIGIRSIPLGFDPQRVLTMYVSLQERTFGTGTIDEAHARRLVFYHQLVDSARSIPGVEQVGVGFPLPLSNTPIPQRFSTGHGQPERAAEGVIALAGYLETLKVPLVTGRYFAAADDNQPVIIVDKRLADELWPERSAIGQRLLMSRLPQAQWAEVIGVVEHVQIQDWHGVSLPQIWMSYATRSYAQLNVVVRASNPLPLAPAIAQAVQKLGPGRPVRDIRLLDAFVADSTADTRFALFVLGVFAALAVVLTAIGVYGVVAYSTARRTREIAVRLALGANGGRIVMLVVREGLVWTILGLVAGAAGARLLTRFVASLLFNVTATDATTFAVIGILLAAIALIATALPAFRAVRVDPMLALRAE
ncbi:MAG TPA: ABC transporter permease [Vicinamibacterales bacterium]|nr:ABC transporter permease [Vicinamibacterales bacterium]